MNKTMLTLCGSALVAVAVGCAKDQSDKQAEAPDRHPKPEGRIDVDQSAVLPVDVKAGVQHEFPGSTVQNVRKLTYDDRVARYEVQLTTKEGQHLTRVFDSNGKPAK